METNCIVLSFLFQAVISLQTMVHPVHFLDGRCELLETTPDCLAGEAVALMAKKIGLEDSQGWALYEAGWILKFYLFGVYVALNTLHRSCHDQEVS